MGVIILKTDNVMALKTCCLVTAIVAAVTVVVAVALVVATVMLVDKSTGADVNTSTDDCTIDYCFKEGDDDFCKENYLRIQEDYNSQYEYYQRQHEELMGLYNDILSRMARYNVRMVDNEDFLDWCKTYVSPEADCGNNERCWVSPDDPEPVYTKEVDQYFRSANGAQPLTDIPQLKEALGEMFMWREDNAFEASMMIACRRNLDEMPIAESRMAAPDMSVMALPEDAMPADYYYSDLSTCSDSTKERGYENYANNHHGVDESGDLWSKKSFLRAISAWFDETYG